MIFGGWAGTNALSCQGIYMSGFQPLATFPAPTQAFGLGWYVARFQRLVAFPAPTFHQLTGWGAGSAPG